MGKVRLLDYYQSGLLLLKYLDYKLDVKSGFPDQPSWGYAITYLASLLAHHDCNPSLINKARYHLINQDKSDQNYSWEFIIYAIQTAKKIKHAEIPSELNIYNERGTRMFNWFMLRRLNKNLFGNRQLLNKYKLWFGLALYQNKEGLIQDEFYTRSLQYHSFSLFILAELLENGFDYLWLKKRFIRGVKFSLAHILSDGTSLYIGRGQEQIFGYASLIYSLEYCNAKVEKIDEQILDTLRTKLLSFQGHDGSFPLVLRSREREKPCLNFKNDKPPGWYGYNSLYDYQPFLAYCLLKVGSLACR